MVVGRKRKYDFSNAADVARYQEQLRTNASRRRQMTKRCPTCKEDFVGWANRLYCSDACRQRAFYQRQKQQDG